MDEPEGTWPAAKPAASPSPAPRPVPPETRRPSRLWPMLGALGLLVGIGALGASAYLATQRDSEILRLSTELAQLKVSLDLYARNAAATPETAPASDEIAALTDRLAALEEAASASPPAALPDLPAEAVPTQIATGEDCLPPGMRLLVAMGDSYAICGQPANVEVEMVDNGYITLAGGITVPSGGTMPLPDSACTIGVTSGGDEGVTGYAEIRVTC